MNISRTMSLRMFTRGIWNLWRKYPLSVSFEVTHACTANCWHCNWGGAIKETRRSPEEYGRIARELKPLVAHVSGGEPLARGDADECVRAIAEPGSLPWMVVVSNASQLTPERFLRLKNAGMHQLSISIDFPDRRHDEFRRIPGLFDRMAEVIPECARIGDAEDVSLNCCITRWNYKDIPDVVRLAKSWGVAVNFSAYTPLRTDDQSGVFSDDASKAELRRSIAQVLDLRRKGYPVFTAERVFDRLYRFMTSGYMPGCQAGYRFLVINPDGRLTPCAMVMAYFDTHTAMQQGFSDQNTCGACYVSTRANTEKTIKEFLADNVPMLRRLAPLGNNGGPPFFALESAAAAAHEPSPPATVSLR
jgi:MoaA/NifB/PqqE/SkfB family radical SAM enzyme